MSDCSTNAWNVPARDVQEPNVLYQHSVYPASVIEQVSAIEIKGVRFSRPIKAHQLSDEDGQRYCELCMCDIDATDSYCRNCGAMFYVD